MPFIGGVVLTTIKSWQKKILHPQTKCCFTDSLGKHKTVRALTQLSSASLGMRVSETNPISPEILDLDAKGKS